MDNAARGHLVQPAGLDERGEDAGRKAVELRDEGIR